MFSVDEFKTKVKEIMEGSETDLPYRNRVEVFAVKDGKVYGGFYPDGAFGTFGGGTDGESLEGACKREYKEETGYTIKNVQKLDIPAVEVGWKTSPKNEKQEERQKKYKGTRSWYFYAELGDKGKKATGEDGESALKDIGLIDIDKAIKSLDRKGGDESIKAQMNARKKALKILKEKLDGMV